MHILAIETSCDETGVAIVEVDTHDNTTNVSLLAQTLQSQATLHSEYGGVYPTLAKREHAKNLVPLFTQALQNAQLFEPADTPEVTKDQLDTIKEILDREQELFARLLLVFAQIKKPDIQAIAVTTGPGLEPALWVGVNFARALAHAWDIPVIPVNHMEGHIAAALATQTSDTQFSLSEPALPMLSLLISGGHTELVLSKTWTTYEKVGSTRDDAVGEAFDKSARLLGLPYPGGPEVSKLAQEAREHKYTCAFSLPRPMLDSDSLDFSFSGLKTAVRTLIESIDEPTHEQRACIARELEDAITDVLVTKTQRALDAHAVRTLIVSGGVAANTHIRSALETLVAQYPHVSLHFPTPQLATDNGVMIALAATLHDTTTTDIHANGNLSLDGEHRKSAKQQ